jgi:hypothetical protein
MFAMTYVFSEQRQAACQLRHIGKRLAGQRRGVHYSEMR